MKTLSTHAHAAKLIRQDLKQAFTGIQFKVFWQRGTSDEFIQQAYDLYIKDWSEFKGVTDFGQEIYTNRYTTIRGEALRLLSHLDLRIPLTTQLLKDAR
jgi:hypothetical protein